MSDITWPAANIVLLLAILINIVSILISIDTFFIQKRIRHKLEKLNGQS